MPLATEMIDMIRASCPGAKVLWVSEGGKELGRKPGLEPGAFEIDGKTYCDMADERARRVVGGKRK